EGDGLAFDAAYACPKDVARVTVTYFFLSDLAPAHRHAARLAVPGATVERLLSGTARAMHADVTGRTLKRASAPGPRIAENAHLGISRASPAKDKESMARTLDALDRLGVGRLITIGGDGTAYTAYRLAEASAGALRVVHVPKTIDNDLELPQETSTFGFQTAR